MYACGTLNDEWHKINVKSGCQPLTGMNMDWCGIVCVCVCMFKFVIGCLNGEWRTKKKRNPYGVNRVFTSVHYFGFHFWHSNPYIIRFIPKSTRIYLYLFSEWN